MKPEQQKSMGNGMLVLIAARPGRLRDGLRALLTATPQIAAIDQADECHSAMEMVAQYHPNLVFLDSSLADDEIQAVLKQLKEEPTQPRCIVLVDNDQQQQEAKIFGADAVLVKGFSAAKLFMTIDRLLTSVQP